MQYVRSLAFTTFLFAWTLLYAVFFVIVAPFVDLRRRNALGRLWSRAIMGMLRATCGLGYRVSGREHIPPGAHVALWKHSSAWETLAMVDILPPQVWVLKRELLWIPIVGWGVRLMHSIAIDRKSGHTAVQQVVAQGRERLAEGLWVMLFPEGTRMPAGETRRWGVSGTLLAREAGCLIVPVAHDAGYYWARRGLLKKPGTIDVRIGPRIDPAGRDPREVNEQAQAWVEDAIRAMRAAKAAGD
jgi:1-acyl-sn-glycerol-3-phosphate acyltransferase